MFLLRSRIHPTPLVVATLVTLVVVTACSSGSSGQAKTDRDDGPVVTINVGQIASLTGSAVDYGLPQADGAALAAKGLGPIDHAIRVELDTHDDHSETEDARAAMERVVNSKAVAVIGPTLSPVAEVANPLAAEAGLSVLGATNATLDLSALSTTWRISQSEASMITAAVNAVDADTEIERVVLVVDASDAYAKQSATMFQTAAAEVGWTVSEVAFNGPDDAPLAAGQAIAQTPDALLLAARSDAAVAIAVATYGFSGARIGGNGFNAPGLLTKAGAAADDIVVGGSWNFTAARASQSEFIHAYRSTYDRDPDAFAALGYASVQVLVAAAAQTDDHSREGIAKALENLGSIDTVLGTVRFENRSLVYPVVVQVVEHGVFVRRPGS